ncbi:MAG: transketolase, partial [Planctomycetota bacterium]
MSVTTMPITELAQRVRRLQLAAIFHAGSGHPGGSLSCTDILVWLWEFLYRDDEPNRATGGEQFVLSKGHAAPALYAVGAEFGLITPAEAMRLRKLDSPCQGHPHVIDLPWTGASTGSLGQGFSVAVGKALALRHRNLDGHVTVILGDGELQEGEVWEAAMSAAHHKLGKLSVVVDFNKLQSDDLNSNICGLEPLADKWRSFGWRTLEVDGHDFDALGRAFAEARSESDQPTCIIAHTIKGQGIGYMEASPLWHGSVCLTEKQLRDALIELETPEAEIADWIKGEAPR